MEHIVRSLNKAPELSEYIEEGYSDAPEDIEAGSEAGSDAVGARNLAPTPVEPGLQSQRSTSAASTHDVSNEAVAPEMESRFFTSLAPNGERSGNRLSIADVADRHLRDKTDAIAYIIRNISDQCAAAVEGLHLAQHADTEDATADEAATIDPDLPATNGASQQPTGHRHKDTDSTDAASDAASHLGDEHDSGHGGSTTGFLIPHNEEALISGGGKDESEGPRSQSRASSILPPTPDLIDGRGRNEPARSSTSMSGYSNSTVPTTHGGGRDSGAAVWGGQMDLGKGMRVVGADESVIDEEEGEALGEGGRKRGLGGRLGVGRGVPA